MRAEGGAEGGDVLPMIPEPDETFRIEFPVLHLAVAMRVEFYDADRAAAAQAMGPPLSRMLSNGRLVVFRITTRPAVASSPARLARPG